MIPGSSSFRQRHWSCLILLLIVAVVGIIVWTTTTCVSGSILEWNERNEKFQHNHECHHHHQEEEMERLHVKGMELKDGHDEPDRHDHHKNGMVSRMWTVLAWRKTLDFLGRKMWLASDMQGMDHNNNQHETSSSLHSTFTSNVINTINTINSNNNNTHSPLQPPADVLLYYYNASDFEFLVSNLTNNTQAAQGLIVLTASSTLQSWIIIPLRMMVIVMDVILFFGLVIFRNKEPVKSKFIPSMLLLFVNFIGNLQSIVDRIPVVKLLFQTYWNEYLLEKLANPLLDASLYFSEHLFEPYQLPRWFIDWAVFTNVYCYLVAYGLYTISILGVVIYNIQLSRFLLLTFLKERKDQFRNAMIAFKEKQLEKWKNVKMQKLQEKERQKNTDTGGVNLSSLEKRKSVKSLSRASVSSLSSSSVDVTSQTHLVPTINLTAVQSVSSSTSTDSLPAVTPRSSMIYNTMQGTDEALTDDSFDTEDMVVDLTSDDDAVSTSLEEISKFGKGVKILKFLERYRLIDIGIYTMWLVIWWILVSIAIFTVSTDTTGAIFPKWNLIRGYCSGNAYLNVITFALIMFSVIFLVAMISWFFDLFVSIYKYVKRRKADQLNSVKTSNFLFYHFVETDPFVYRATFLMNMTFSFIGAVIALFFWNSTNFVGSLIIDLCFTLFVNFLGGCVANPGITVARALYDYVKSSSHRSKKTNSTQDQPSKSTTIKNLKELVHAPSSSDCLNYIIAHAKERELFYSHLREEFSSENLLFTEALTSLKKINDKFMRRKMMKLKEIVKLYLSESESVFEVNLPSVLVRNQLKPYFVVTKFMDEQNMSVNDLPKMLKDVAAQMFPNVTQDVETKVRNAYTEICHPQFLSGVQTEVYKNLLDSYFRFMGSRKWLNFVKENNV